MKQMLPLRTIEYNVPLPAKSTRHVGADGEIGLEQPTSLLHAHIDFQSGQLQLDGNWKFIMSSNSQAEKSWFNLHQEWIHLSATVYPGQAVDLSDAKAGAAFAVEGVLSDGDTEAEYTGLLLLDPGKANNITNVQSWKLSLYLYNTESDDCEIKLSWTFYPAAKLGEMN
jgi:hypothetical protein